MTFTLETVRRVLTLSAVGKRQLSLTTTRKVVDLSQRGARGAIGLDVVGDPALRPGNIVQFIAGGNNRRVAPVPLPVDGADPTLRTALASWVGAFLVTHKLPTDGSVPLTVADIMGERISCKWFGAIGAGVSTPVSEWLVGGSREHPAGFTSLAAIQVAYPDVFDITNTIDFAAMNALIRYMAITGIGGFWAPGRYMGWIYGYYSNLDMKGAGSRCTEIMLPPNAAHTRNYGGSDLVGTPNIIELNRLDYGNDPHPMSNCSVEGMTLNGDLANNTTVPPEDIFGWGLGANQTKLVKARDLYVKNVHAGGLGLFINSDRFDVEVEVDNAGKSVIGGAQRPAVDLNSSNDGYIKVNGSNSQFGFRALDNCRGVHARGNLTGILQTGLIFSNQTSNASAGCSFDFEIRGGCSDRGGVVGPKCSASHLALRVSDIDGEAFRELGNDIGYTDAQQPTNIEYEINSTRCKGGGSLFFGIGAHGSVASTDDGDPAETDPTNFRYAVTLGGKKARFATSLIDTRTPKVLRGLRFEIGSSDNVAFGNPSTLNTYDDVGTNNRFIGVAPSWNVVDGVGQPPFASGYANDVTIAGTPATAFAIDSTETEKQVRLRISVGGPGGGTTGFTLPTGYRPADTQFFGDITIKSDGSVVFNGTGPWRNSSVRFAVS